MQSSTTGDGASPRVQGPEDPKGNANQGAQDQNNEASEEVQDPNANQGAQDQNNEASEEVQDPNANQGAQDQNNEVSEEVQDQVSQGVKEYYKFPLPPSPPHEKWLDYCGHVSNSSRACIIKSIWLMQKQNK